MVFLFVSITFGQILDDFLNRAFLNTFLMYCILYLKKGKAMYTTVLYILYRHSSCMFCLFIQGNVIVPTYCFRFEDDFVILFWHHHLKQNIMLSCHLIICRSIELKINFSREIVFPPLSCKDHNNLLYNMKFSRHFNFAKLKWSYFTKF